MTSATPTERYQDFIRRQKCMGIRQFMRLRKQYIQSLPAWRRPSVGYLCAVPIFLLALFIAVFLQNLLNRFLFPGTFLLMSILLVALVWGTGPAVWMLIISTIAIDYYFVPLIGHFALINGGDFLQVLPIFVNGLVIVLVTGQRERAYINAQVDEWELQRYASELEALNSRLDEAIDEKDRFFSIASHELKTPITTIRGQSQLLLRRLAKRSTSIDIKDVESAFRRVNEQTVRLTTLIDQLLDVSTLHSERAVLWKSKYDLNLLCCKVIEDQRFLTGREVLFSPSSEPLELQMDIDRITQVVINLVGNGIKYSPEDKPVEVRVSRNGHGALLQVQDHGYGIASDEIPHIFEMFYRTRQAHSSTTKGLGLGLAISKDIIDLHEGRIWCESELGVGSTFFVELPLWVGG